MKKIFSLTALSIFALSSLFLSSCKKEEEIEDDHNDGHTHATTGALAFELNAMFGDSLLELNTGEQYTTANGDLVDASMFKFYISNIVLTKSSGETWAQPESYYLCNAANLASMRFTLPDVPIGEYNQISFMIGVDSLRNVSGTQSGALDPANNMFWTWSSGYIFMKFEGNSPQSMSSGNNVTYHIGGYEGVNRGQRIVTLPLTATTALVTESTTPRIFLNVDAGEIFESPNTISIASLSFAMGVNSSSAMIADNYANMFSLVNVVN
ncbi:MAG: MbnP family protein [Bacteroidia bacterium]